MTKRKQLLILLVIVMSMALSFAGGFNAPDLLAASTMGRQWLNSFQMLPESIDPSAVVRSGGASLPPVETYWNVLSRIRTDYYGTGGTDQELTYSAVRGMLKALNDPYTRFLDPKEYNLMQEENQGQFVGIGAQLDDKRGRVEIVAPIPNSPAMRADLRTGDIIVKVDEVATKGLDINLVVKRIRGKIGTQVTLSIERKGVKGLKDYKLIRDNIVFPNVVDVEKHPVTAASKLADEKAKIGYVALRQFNEQSDAKLNDALTIMDKKGAKAMILDLRGNPGGLLSQAVDIASRFVADGPAVIIEERGGQRNPLLVEKSKHNHRAMPLVVLVNKGSASASEIVSGAIKDNGAGTLVGSTTFGKGLVQTIIPLPDGSALSITTARYLTPKGVDINKKGIEPDIAVQMTEEQFKANNDVQLKRAVEVLKERLHLSEKPASKS